MSYFINDTTNALNINYNYVNDHDNSKKVSSNVFNYHINNLNNNSNNFQQYLTTNALNTQLEFTSNYSKVLNQGTSNYFSQYSLATFTSNYIQSTSNNFRQYLTSSAITTSLSTNTLSVGSNTNYGLTLKLASGQNHSLWGSSGALWLQNTNTTFAMTLILMSAINDGTQQVSLQIYWKAANTGNDEGLILGWITANNSYGIYTYNRGGTGVNRPLYITTAGNTNQIYLDSTGNIGIGKNNPNYKLDVNGDINATNIYESGILLSNKYGTFTSNYNVVLNQQTSNNFLQYPLTSYLTTQINNNSNNFKWININSLSSNEIKQYTLSP